VAQGESEWLNRPAVGKVEKRVLALYYPWYSTPAVSGRWAHQDGVEAANKRMASHTHYPLAGPYDSAHPAVIERHLRQAKEAGIDTLVCSWWGRQDPTDKAIRLLMERAPAHGLSVCLFWERLSPRPDRLAASADLAYLLQTFGDKPGALRIQNKPVLFLTSAVCQSLSASDWEEVLSLTLKRFPGGFVPIGTGERLSDALLWDGLHSLDVATPMPEQNAAASARTLHERSMAANLLARRLGHIAVETVLPGYDDRKPNATSALPGRKLVQREDGALYRALWSQAMADGPDWILLSSFNQWHNGTEIEPSVEMGDRYLTLTQELATHFKQGAAGKQTARP
jgi:glycoprotein endo-alpha-1,2-mannosidase